MSEPIYCMYCQRTIEPDDVSWSDRDGVVCHPCHNEILADVAE